MSKQHSVILKDLVIYFLVKKNKPKQKDNRCLALQLKCKGINESQKKKQKKNWVWSELNIHHQTDEQQKENVLQII